MNFFSLGEGLKVNELNTFTPRSQQKKKKEKEKEKKK